MPRPRLSPVENDILNGTRFALAWRDNEVKFPRPDLD
jgi:hypothetical protein